MRFERRKALSRGTRWTKDQEAALVNYLEKNDFDHQKLTEMFPNRSLQAIRNKVRKLRIKYDLFGNSYRGEKCRFTDLVAQTVSLKTVFEGYAGAGHQTLRWLEYVDTICVAEKNPNLFKLFKQNLETAGFSQSSHNICAWNLFESERKKIFLYCGDAIEAASDLRSKSVGIDLIDLDTCGSTIPTLPLFLILLRPKHLVITHGEFHSLRFKRDDVLRRILCHNSVNKSPLPMTIDDLALELDKAVKISALRAHNETIDSYWLELINEIWLGTKIHGMLRRHYKVKKPPATADCINYLLSS
jgi:hypothetical protein